MLLPCLLSSVIVVAIVVLLRAAIAVVVVVRRTTILSSIGRDREGFSSRVLSLKLHFMIKQLLMDFSKGGRRIASLDLNHYRLVFVRQSLKDELKLIFNVKWFSKQCELVKTSSKTLDVGID